MYTQVRKIVIIGDSGVGKTSIVKYYLLNINKRLISSLSHDDVEPTIGASYYTINIDTTKLQIWDTAGQERFKSICPIYYRGSNGCICVFDVTNRTSFDNVDEWITSFKQHTYTEAEYNILLLANKVDCDKSKWQVSPEDIRRKVKQLNCQCILTSTITMENHDAFIVYIRSVYAIERDNTENMGNNIVSLGMSSSLPDDLDNNLGSKYSCYYIC